MPLPPSTRTRSPVRRRCVPDWVPTMHGMPSSRATTAAWAKGPPMSTTSAAETKRMDAQLGSVVGALQYELTDADRALIEQIREHGVSHQH